MAPSSPFSAGAPGAEHARSGPAQGGAAPDPVPGLALGLGPGASARVPSERLAQLKTEAELAHYDWMTQNVPRTQGEALALFFSRPAILTCSCILATVACLRLLGPGEPPLGPADGLVLVGVALWWVLQEWVIHARLLHSAIPWWGRKVHETHHALPYYHVSIDGFKVVLPTMLLGCAAMRLVFQSRGLFLTALVGYYGMGLAYEWTHFLVHTRVPMRTLLGRVIRRAHVKHHLRDQRFWFSFTCPPLDNLMGTTPDPWTVA